MAAEVKKEIALKIAHVLFIDIVGYSKLSINEQRAAVDELTKIVRATERFQKADASKRLIKIATGDGMALVFYTTPEAPIRCAIELSRALKDHPHLRLRMGIHSGPVSGVVDVTGQANLTGAGLNLAHRAMECGDAGHILLSKHVAEDLEEYEEWRPRLHDLGTCEVKHGVRIGVVNLCDSEVGNPQLPRKFQALKKRRTYVRWAKATFALLVLCAVVASFVLVSRRPVRSTVTVPEKSIAVLPFENLSRDPDNAYFATGIQDEILTRIAKIGALKVIARTSTQQYAARPGNLSEIARQLGVAYILEGAVQKAGDQVHLNVQLIRAATDEHLWAESYDRKLENIFGVEAEVATAVAEALNAKLTGTEQQALEQKPTNNPEAYGAYLRGIALYRKDFFGSSLKAAEAFGQAVRIDPTFAIAWAMLSRANALSYGMSATVERQTAAQSSLEKALSLRPDLAEVQLANAFYQYWVLRDFADARRSFESLGAKMPNSADVPEALGMVMRRLGRWDDSRAYMDKAVTLNPRDRLLRCQAAYARCATRDFSAALRSYDEALTIWPDDAEVIREKADLYQALGELDRVDALLAKLHITPENLAGVQTTCYQAILRRRFVEAIPVLRSSLGHWQWGKYAYPSRIYGSFFRQRLGDLQRLSGNIADAKMSYSQARDELESSLKEQPAEADLICNGLASVYAGLGQPERALSFVDRALSLTPYSKDATYAPEFEDTRARIAARFGMKDLAIPALEHLLKTPYFAPLTPALLRLDPDFDPLRSDPQFEKLAHSDGK